MGRKKAKKVKVKRDPDHQDEIVSLNKGQPISNGEQLLRMNYLFQISHKLHKKCPNLSRHYMHELRKVGKKNVIRM